MPTTFEGTNTFPQITKDPNAVLDYMVDWTAWLGTDDIEAVEFIVPAQVTKVSEEHDAKTATVWLSGGSANSTHEIVCRITTVAGRVEDRSFLLNMRQR